MSFLFTDAPQVQSSKKTAQDPSASSNEGLKKHNGTPKHKSSMDGTRPSKSTVKSSDTPQKTKVKSKSDVKKPSPVKPKPRPVISDSDSEDDGPVPVKKRAVEQASTVEDEQVKVVNKEKAKAKDDLVKDEVKLKEKSTTPSSEPTPKEKSKKDKEKSSKKRKRPEPSDSEQDEEDDDDFKVKRQRGAASKASKKCVKRVKSAPITKVKIEEEQGKQTASPKKKKGAEEEKEIWKWWEEAPRQDGVKWTTLEHKGPYFAPLYERLPDDVPFIYDGKPYPLSEAAEEVATFFAKMLDHDYTKKDVFVKNFWNDWRKEMTAEEAARIKSFDKCDFSKIHQYFKEKSEAKKQLSKEEKQKIKEEQAAIQEEYGWCMIDGHKEKIGNFKTEPPGLFRGRGEHPKQGMVKKRIQPEDVIINIGKKAVQPKPPPGHKWKAVQNDNKVTWLASWTDNIQGQIKYIMLNPTSRLKGEKDWAKYETARKLKDSVDEIRRQYKDDWKSKEMRIRQRAVAVYFIDKLALRAGNEKDSDETADTVGCCSLRVEHLKLHEELDGQHNVIEFDFLGKDSIRYYNKVPVDAQVFKNVKLFMKNKEPGDDLFDRLNTGILNKHLSELMEGLTAKVFRTYNASKTLQEQLELLTNPDDIVTSKLLSYNRANRAVAVLCNHQRAIPKAFDKQMSNIQAKIEAKEEAIIEAQQELKAIKREAKSNASMAKKLDSKKKQIERLEEQLQKLEVQATDKEENKDIALGTSKLNYLDPRISVSWCKKWEVPVEKVYNKTQREKFAWAIDMADETFEF